MPAHTSHLSVSDDNWREPDLSILDDRRAPVPDVPLTLLPPPWRDWIVETAQATAAPTDYVVSSVLAGVAAICGAGVQVRVTPAWTEPLVLWQVVVGEPSTGKSAALAPMRRLLDTMDKARRHADGAGDREAASAASQIVVSNVEPASLAGIVSGNPRGVLLWRDGVAEWLGEEGTRQDALALATIPVSILETVRPERLKESLSGVEDGVVATLAARFLFAWPGPQPYRALVARDPASRDAEISSRLRALSRLARTAEDPCDLQVDARGLAALDGVLAGLHAERQKADVLEAAWLGRSRSFIVRLAGMLELLASTDAACCRPGAIGAGQVEAAATLWRDYFWPHARSVFDGAELSDHARRVRRVARWLVRTRPATLSREDVRRRALSQAATASDTQHVLERLHFLGFVRPDTTFRGGPGRPAHRWQLNPALVENG